VNRAPLPELHVVRRCIGEDEAPVERGDLEIEMGERSVLELREAPFVRIGDQRDQRMLDQPHGRFATGACEGMLERRLKRHDRCRQDQPGSLEIRDEA
jgi:hypothetical protein